MAKANSSPDTYAQKEKIKEEIRYAEACRVTRDLLVQKGAGDLLPMLGLGEAV